MYFSATVSWRNTIDISSPNADKVKIEALLNERESRWKLYQELELKVKELQAANAKHAQDFTSTNTTGAPDTEDGAWEVEQLPIMKSKSRGFVPVYIYGGNVPEFRKYSQANQDRFVMALLDASVKKKDKRNPGIMEKSRYFVDLAANDAVVFSNTLRLEREGNWSGLCIEPNPRYWYKLASKRSCVIVGTFVGGTEDGVEMNVNFPKQGDLGSLAGKATSGNQEKRNIVSISTLFKETNVPDTIDYFSLDVEGAESLVMSDFPFEKYKFKIMTLERPKDDLKDLLRNHGYKQIMKLTLWGETLWVNTNLIDLSEEEMVRMLDDICDEFPYRSMHNKTERYDDL